ncbi:MAG: hypothetical protein N2C14_18550, partial [Planctomycetales bacterium]
MKTVFHLSVGTLPLSLCLGLLAGCGPGGKAPNAESPNAESREIAETVVPMEELPMTEDAPKPNPTDSNNEDEDADSVAETLPNPVPAGVEAASDAANSVELIPRDLLFGNPDKAAARVSPDGKRISFLAPVDGVLNIWVAPREKPAEAKPVTQDAARGIRVYFWAFTSGHLLYQQDADGDENWRIYSVNVETEETKDLTPLAGVAARIEEVSHRFPNEIMVGLNDRNKELHDLYRVNIETGERELVEENPGFLGYVSDDDYRVRFASQFSPDGSTVFLQRDDAGAWKPWLTIPHQDTLTT